MESPTPKQSTEVRLAICMLSFPSGWQCSYLLEKCLFFIHKPTECILYEVCPCSTRWGLGYWKPRVCSLHSWCSSGSDYIWFEGMNKSLGDISRYISVISPPLLCSTLFKSIGFSDSMSLLVLNFQACSTTFVIKVSESYIWMLLYASLHLEDGLARGSQQDVWGWQWW